MLDILFFENDSKSNCLESESDDIIDKSGCIFILPDV